MKYQLSKLEQIEPREIIHPEEEWFGTWLMDPKNLVQLSTVVGVKFAYGPVAESPGAPRSCIVLHDVTTRQPVYIHPRVDRLNEAYLAGLFRYLTQCEAGVFLWVATKIDDKLKETIKWLNSITNDSVQFFAIRVNFWRIGHSVPAPIFHVECAPVDWHSPVGLALPTNKSVSLTSHSTVSLSQPSELEVAAAPVEAENTQDPLKSSAVLTPEAGDPPFSGAASSLTQDTELRSDEPAQVNDTLFPVMPTIPLSTVESNALNEDVPLLNARAEFEYETSPNEINTNQTLGEHATINEESVRVAGLDDAHGDIPDERETSIGNINTIDENTTWKEHEGVQNNLLEYDTTPAINFGEHTYKSESDNAVDNRGAAHGQHLQNLQQPQQDSQQVKDPPRERRTSFLEGFLQRARGRPAPTEEFSTPPTSFDSLSDPPALRDSAISSSGRRWPQRQVLPVPATWPEDLDSQLEVITNFWKELNDLIAQRRGALRPTLAFPQMWITFPTGHPDYVLAAELNPEAHVALVKLRLSGKTSADDFAILESHHHQIESQVGQSLLWQHNADERVICAERHGVDITSPRDWRSTQQWMADVLEQMYQLVTRWTS